MKKTTIVLSEEQFARVVRDRLVDIKWVQNRLGLTTTMGVRHRVKRGTCPAPLISLHRGYSFWDRKSFDPPA